jgi:hypothetical protein|tara:strand:- start:1569 stop:2123 length:555 start_codon:yes stop_codon:yes gene_type:complete
MSNNEKLSIALKSLLGLYGINSFMAITYEIGKIILPAALLIGGIAFLGSSIGNEVNLKNASIGLVLMGGANFLLNLFSNEKSSLIKLPVDELFNQFKLSSCNELSFIHFKERQRIVVYFDGNFNFVLGECDSEHLVNDYMDYIKSESVYSKNGKMENMKPELSIDKRDTDTAIIAKFTRNSAAH